MKISAENRIMNSVNSGKKLKCCTQLQSLECYKQLQNLEIRMHAHCRIRMVQMAAEYRMW